IHVNEPVPVEGRRAGVVNGRWRRGSRLRFVHRQFGGGIRLQPFVGDGSAAADRPTERARLESLLGSLDRSQPGAKSRRDGVVGGFSGERLGGITEAAVLIGRRPVIARRVGAVTKQLLEPRSLGLEQLSSASFVHLVLLCR